jgi:sporulation protein YlmC with PRC-barrel domain
MYTLDYKKATSIVRAMYLFESQYLKCRCFVMDTSLLNGKKVIGAQSLILGEVEGVDVDSNTWQVSTMYVSLSDEAAIGFGLRKPFMSKITICLPTQIVKSLGDVITLKEPLYNLDGAANQCVINPTKLKGKTVMGAKGHAIGEVEALEVEPANWQVTSLQVSLTKDAATELGFNKTFLSKIVIAIPTKIVSSVGNMIILIEGIQDLKSLVKCLECG